MRFQVKGDITAISVEEESFAVQNGVVQVPDRSAVKVALEQFIRDGVLTPLPDIVPPAPTEPPSPPAPPSENDDSKKDKSKSKDK